MPASITVSPRVGVSTINNQLKKLTRPGRMKRRLLALIDTSGRIKYNCGGKKTDWRVEFKETEPVEYDDMDPIAAARVTRHRTAELGWRSWVDGELISKAEKLQNQNQKGKVALFDIVDEMITLQSRSFNKFMQKQPFLDGDSSGNRYMHGLETLHNGTTTSTGKRGVPGGVYAGLNMLLDYYGQGSWTGGTWPEGNGLLQYFFYSPIIADYTSTSFTEVSTQTWFTTWRYAMGYCQTYLEALHSKVVDYWVMTPKMLLDCRNSLIDKERIEVTQDKQVVNLGFKNVVWQGETLISDQACTADVCYGLVMDELQLRSMLPQLIQKQDDSDIDTLTQKFVLDCWCNMKFTTPAYFPGLRAIT